MTRDPSPVIEPSVGSAPIVGCTSPPSVSSTLFSPFEFENERLPRIPKNTQVKNTLNHCQLLSFFPTSFLEIKRMVGRNTDGIDDERVGARCPGPPLMNVLRGLYGYRVHPNNISPAKGGPHGWGGKSDVFMATLVREPDKYNHWQQSKVQVAVKKLRFDSDPVHYNRTSKAFVHELGILSALHHPNITKLVGFVEDLQHGVAWLVSPWEEHGNVHQFLMTMKCSIPERISLIQDMLEGVVYLHTRDPPICHGDLKSLNILVNASYRAVITDFGSARAVKESTQLEDIEPLQDFEARIEASAIDSVTDLTLTEREYSSRWAAPEVLMGKQANLASDIWAAAWTIWEILTDEFPFSQTNSEGVITLNIIDGKVPQSIRGEQMSQIRSLFRLMMTCWKPDPIKRPSAGACLAEVRRLPSVVPSIPTFFGIKIRSTGIISTPAHIRYLTSDFKRARSILRDALSVARSKEDQLAVANVSFSLGRAYRTRGEYRLAEEAFIHAQVYYASAGNSAGRARAFDELGSVYRAQCQYSVAEGSYLRARKIYTCLKDHLGRASTLCGLGDVYRARCKYEEAEELYQEARGIYARIGEDRGRANVLLGLGEMYSARSRYRKAEETLLHARDIFTSLRDNFGCANALNGLGDVYRAQCRYDEAERSYRSAQVLHHASGDDLGRANALLGLGEVYHARGKHREAATKFTQAHAICDQIGNDTDRLNTLLGLGNIYSTQRKYKTAEKFFNQALNLAARTDNDLGRANALRGLGNVQHAQHQDAQAEYSFGPALDLYERVGNDLGCADALLGLGLAYQAQTKWDEAEESFSQAQYIYAAVRNDVGRANALSGLADVYHALGLYSDAEESFRQARALYAGLGDEMGEANALLGVGEACVAQNKYKEAKEAFTTAEALYRKRGSDASRANVLRALDLLPHDRGSTEAEDADIISPRYLPSPFQDRGGGGKTGGTKAATDAVRGEICRDIRAIGVLPGEQRYKKGPDIASSLPKCGSSSFDSHADGEADGVQSPHGEPPVPTDRPPTIVQRGSKSSLRCCPYPGAQPELK